jgi:hypothetical protein
MIMLTISFASASSVIYEPNHDVNTFFGNESDPTFTFLASRPQVCYKDCHFFNLICKTKCYHTGARFTLYTNHTGTWTSHGTLNGLTNHHYSMKIPINDIAEASNYAWNVLVEIPYDGFVGFASSNHTFNVDKTYPSLKVNLPIEGQNLSSTATPVILNATVIDVLSGAEDSVEFRVTNAETYFTYNAFLSNGHYINNTMDTKLLTEGLHNFTIIASDKAGNKNITYVNNVMVDNIAPSLNLITPVNNSNLTGINTINISSVDSGTGVKDVWFNVSNISLGVEEIYTATNNGEYWYNDSMDTTLLVDGKYNFTIYSRDYANNINTSLNKITIDNTPPNFYNVELNPVPTYVDGVNLTAIVNDTMTTINETWIYGNWTGVWENHTVNNFTDQKYNFTINTTYLENQEIIGYMWCANDSALNTNCSDLYEFQIQNRAPLFNVSNNISDLFWVEDVAYAPKFALINLSEHFYDLDNDHLNYTAVLEASTPGLTYEINNETGMAKVISANEWSGKGNITFTAHDILGLTALSNLVNITVEGQENKKPELYSTLSPVVFVENTTISFNIICDPRDVGQICKNYRYDSAYASYNGNVSVEINESGFVELKPEENWFGITYIKFLVDDNGTPLMTGDLTVKVNITNINDIPVIVSEPKTTALEEQEYCYKVIVEDKDNVAQPGTDVLKFTLLKSPVGMYVDESRGYIYWKPEKDTSGTYNVTIKVEDGKGGEVNQSFQVDVRKDNFFEMTASPIKDNFYILDDFNQEFKIETTAKPNYTWYVNDNEVSNKSSYIFNSSVAGDFKIKVVAKNLDFTNEKQWNVSVTEIPLSKTFNTINFSNVVDISKAKGVFINNTYGKINFTNQELDLSNVLYLEDGVRIEDNVVAINNSLYPQLNKPAVITLKNVSYNTTPKIFYSENYSAKPSEITLNCSFCKVINYTAFPTTR